MRRLKHILSRLSLALDRYALIHNLVIKSIFNDIENKIANINNVNKYH